MTPALQFDQLHVISDLHLGGAKPFQIFGSTQELAGLIDHLTQLAPASRVGLVINGDFIDFLAEEPSTYFDPEGATAKMDRIMADVTFKPVFDALRRFVGTERRTLIINLGNHDLELALPWVRTHLLASLCGSSSAALGRVMVIVDGSGVLCDVGGSRVLCLHGNEVDSWNVADFEKIRRIGRDAQAGQSVAEWIPNAGTQMVIEVMNSIKRRYPFVDLLKPEAQAVVPTLLALDASALQKLRGVATVAGRRAWDAARMSTGFLGDVDSAETMGPAWGSRGSDAFSSVGTETPGLGGTRSAARSVELMDAAEQAMLDGVQPIDLVRGEQGRELGFWSAAWDAVRRKPTHEMLADALDGLDKDRSFDFTAPDDTSKRLDAMVSPDIRFLIAGHTHLERALVRRDGRTYYFNSGTWARLIKLEPDVRKDLEQFRRVFDVFKGGQMEDLDAHPGLVVKRCSVVSVVSDPPGNTYGELRRMSAGQLQPVPGSRLPAP